MILKERNLHAKRLHSYHFVWKTKYGHHVLQGDYTVFPIFYNSEEYTEHKTPTLESKKKYIKKLIIFYIPKSLKFLCVARKKLSSWKIENCIFFGRRRSGDKIFFFPWQPVFRKESINRHVLFYLEKGDRETNPSQYQGHQAHLAKPDVLSHIERLDIIFYELNHLKNNML